MEQWSIGKDICTTPILRYSKSVSKVFECSSIRVMS
jgi:hypothetical protein